MQGSSTGMWGHCRQQNGLSAQVCRLLGVWEGRVLVPDSLLGVPKGLSEAGKVRVEVRGRGDDFQEPGMDLCGEPGGQEGQWCAAFRTQNTARAKLTSLHPFFKAHQADIPTLYPA